MVKKLKFFDNQGKTIKILAKNAKFWLFLSCTFQKQSCHPGYMFFVKNQVPIINNNLFDTTKKVAIIEKSENL